MTPENLTLAGTILAVIAAILGILREMIGLWRDCLQHRTIPSLLPAASAPLRTRGVPFLLVLLLVSCMMFVALNGIAMGALHAVLSPFNVPNGSYGVAGFLLLLAAVFSSFVALKDFPRELKILAVYASAVCVCVGEATGEFMPHSPDLALSNTSAFVSAGLFVLTGASAAVLWRHLTKRFSQQPSTPQDSIAVIDHAGCSG